MSETNVTHSGLTRYRAGGYGAMVEDEQGPWVRAEIAEELLAALRDALGGIDDVAAQASLCAHHVVPHEHQRTWLRSEVRREADAVLRRIRAAIAKAEGRDA